MSEKVSQPRLGEVTFDAESFKWEEQIFTLFKKKLGKLYPYRQGRKQIEVSQEEQDAHLNIQLIARYIARCMQEGDPVDFEAVNRMTIHALSGKSFVSFVKSMKDWKKYLTGISVFRRACPTYFPRPVLEEINKQWGRIDAALIFQTYVIDKIPKSQWPDLRGYVGASDQ